MFIPFGLGGESDISARLQEPVFKVLTGQSMAIQYKPGAGGAVSWASLLIETCCANKLVSMGL